jgi:TolB-like protein
VVKLLQINLFGACHVRSTVAVDATPPGFPAGFEIKAAKHRALFALLATAPSGRRTRSYLQNLLWGASCHDGGRQSLRTALSMIKTRMGPAFDQLMQVNNTEVSLDLSKVDFTGSPGAGEFLEGIDIRDDLFNEWLMTVRQAPEPYFTLLSGHVPTPSAPPLRPSISVLPFRLVVGGAEHWVLGDFLAEEICRSLSRSPLLHVISHLSAREVAARQVDMGQLRRVLDVDYCITGNLRVSGNQVVLDADCLDTAGGRILWTRQFSGDLAGFLMADSPVVAQIVRAIGRSLTSDALDHAKGRSLTALADHRVLIAGVSMMHQLKSSSFARARKLFEEAIRRAPRSPEAHAWLAEWHVMSIFNNWSDNGQRDTGLAQDCTARALDIDPTNSFALTIDGVVQTTLLKRMETADAQFNRALDLNPNESLAWLFSGVQRAYCDDGHEAVRRTQKALRLSPADPFGYFFDSLAAAAYLAAGDWQAALTLADRSLAKNDRHVSTLRARICALHYLGRGQEARATADDLRRQQPDFTVEAYRRSHPSAAFKMGQQAIAALVAAGIP